MEYVRIQEYVDKEHSPWAAQWPMHVEHIEAGHPVLPVVASGVRCTVGCYGDMVLG
jgi:hypothetical protein